MVKLSFRFCYFYKEVILIKRWYSDESGMYEHLVGIIKQWRKWKEMDKNNGEG